MYAGKSGCHGMMLYNTNIKGDNAVYGYYERGKVCLRTGTVEEMERLRDIHDEGVPTASNTVRNLVILFVVYLAALVTGFAVLPMRIAFAVLIFCAVSYFPLLIVISAGTGLYSDPELKDQFRRYHGCEHAAMNVLTNKGSAEMETLKKANIYDPECGTAYSGYAVALAVELALLIVFWPGILKAIGVIVLTAIIILVMILVPKINPFTLIQRPVVMRPTEKEYLLAIEIMKKLRELE